jgi:hypothetical protein
MGQLTTDTIREAAQAGFIAYYAGRPGYVWEPKWFPIWDLVAASALTDPEVKPADIHALYNAAALEPVPWTAISTNTKARWIQAHRAILRAGQRREAA